MPENLSTDDLNLILRKKFEKDLVIKKSSLDKFISDGENFANDIFKINATVEWINDAPELHHLYLIAKAFPSSNKILQYFNFKLFFKKEIFFYEKVIPFYKNLEMEYGIRENDTFEFGPSIYRVRLSKNPESTEIDNGVMIIMDDLNAKGYYTMDKIIGLDLDHAILTVKALAKFHALGIALKCHKPDLFELIKANAIPVPVETDVQPTINFFTDELLKDHLGKEYRNQITNMMKCTNFQNSQNPSEPWITLVHNDIWTKNILFHRSPNGNIQDIKFVDFQNYYISSPMKDFLYFVFSSTEYEVISENFDTLLDLYYETFIIVLTKMKSDIKHFTKDSFYKQLKQDAFEEFSHCIFAIKFFCAEINTNSFSSDDIENNILASSPNVLCKKKWHDVLELYVHKNWM